ncbi:MAG: hypothetical protein IKX36_12705 [Prevotella sp.]|nr:hypothetical protein [Prevotella sp.]
MKKISLAIIFVCCTLSLSAQDVIRVNYKGAKPTISDFAWAFLSDYVWDEEEDVLDEARNAAKQVWIRHRKGLPQDEGDKLTVDEKNGYAVYESKSEYESTEDAVRIEMCYWNESDGKHKLFAYNVTCFRNGKYEPGQFDGLSFYRYNNATKTMTSCDAPGFDVQFGTEDGAWVSYDLPRVGKNIIYTEWKDGEKRKQKTLKWNGHKFSL